jgi:hypothetical protein
MKKQPWEKDIENWKNRATVQGVIERVVNKYPYDDSRELFRSELEYLVDQAKQEERRKWRTVIERVRQDPDLGGYSDEEIDEIIDENQVTKGGYQVVSEKPSKRLPDEGTWGTAIPSDNEGGNKQPWEKDIENWKNKEAIPTDEQIIMTYFSCSNDEEQGDSADRFRVLFAPAIAQAKQEEKKKALEILDQAEDENWFDMPDTTENWKTWKRIRNTINDH